MAIRDDRVQPTGWCLNEMERLQPSTLPFLEREETRLPEGASVVSRPLTDLFDEFSTLIAREFEQNPRLMDMMA